MSGVDSPQRRDSYLAASSQTSSSRSLSPLPNDVQGAGGKPRRKLSLFKKSNSDRGRRGSTPSPMPSTEDDDEWLIEGGTSNGRVDPDASMGREASTLSKSVDTLSVESAHGTQPPRPEKRDGRTKRLAKKTSRLFRGAGSSSSNGHKDEDGSGHGGGMANLPIPLAGRQSSFSSSASSNDTGNSRKWGGLGRVHSRDSPLHRSSGESQPSSWHQHQSMTARRASSSTNEDPTHGMSIQTLRPRDSINQLSSSAPQTARPLMSPQPPIRETIRPENVTTGRGWLSNFMGGGESTGSPQQQDVTATPPSPLRKGPGVLVGAFAAVRNKAANGLRGLVDSDAQPDHCQDAMWVMGVAHPGWTPPDDPFSADTSIGDISSPWSQRLREGSGTSQTPPQTNKLSSLFSSSFNLAAQAEGPSTSSPDAAGRYRKGSREPPKWPEQFYDDFRTRVWCTYRSNYAPILPFQENTLLPTPKAYYGAFTGSEYALPAPSPSLQPSSGRGGWLRGETHYTSDSGWGCMLRTGQSMLANALIHVHLGRGWRLPESRPRLHPETPLELAELEAYATHVRVLSWFLDDPSPLCPFSVHRMAMVGKELGKEVGQWFGPSTAAGALRSLANSFPICGLSVVSAQDGAIYKADVYAASNTTTDGWEPQSPRKERPTSVHRTTWGNQAVLILVATRLGLDNVNPIYYESVKTMFTWPQSVGIAGGRPDSSYYFVASQANHLFYLDPHYTRPAVLPRIPPLSAATGEQMQIRQRDSWSEPLLEEDDFDEGVEPHSPTLSQESSHSIPVVGVVDVDRVEESPARVKRNRRLTPMQQSLRIDPQTPERPSDPASPTTPTLSAPRGSSSVHASPAPSRHAAHHSIPSSAHSSMRGRYPLDAQTAWYASAYPEDKMRSFHCDRVKKLPLSGLDPSMLLGFLVQSEAEFEDFCERVAKLPQKIFAVQDELQSWSDDDDGALESVSEASGISGPEMDSEDEEEPEISDVLSDDGFGVDEFGRMGTAPIPSQHGARSRPSADSTPDATPDATLDLSEAEDEARMPRLTGRASFATIPRKPSYSSDVPTVKAHVRGASTSAVRSPPVAASPLAHRRTASALASSSTLSHTRKSSSSGSTSHSGGSSRAGTHSRTHSRVSSRSSGAASPFGPSPIVTARRPPPISVQSGDGVILPPPRSASLSAPTSAKLVQELETHPGPAIPRVLDLDNTEELVTSRSSVEFERHRRERSDPEFELNELARERAERERLEAERNQAERNERERAEFDREFDSFDNDDGRSERNGTSLKDDTGVRGSLDESTETAEAEAEVGTPEDEPTFSPLPRSSKTLPRSTTQDTVMPRSATQETVATLKALPTAASRRWLHEEDEDEWDGEVPDLVEVEVEDVPPPVAEAGEEPSELPWARAVSGPGSRAGSTAKAEELEIEGKLEERETETTTRKPFPVNSAAAQTGPTLELPNPGETVVPHTFEHADAAPLQRRRSTQHAHAEDVSSNHHTTTH